MKEHAEKNANIPKPYGAATSYASANVRNFLDSAPVQRFVERKYNDFRNNPVPHLHWVGANPGETNQRPFAIYNGFVAAAILSQQFTMLEGNPIPEPDRLNLQEAYQKGYATGKDFFKENYLISNDSLTDEAKCRVLLANLYQRVWVADMHPATPMHAQKAGWMDYVQNEPHHWLPYELEEYGFIAGLMYSLGRMFDNWPHLYGIWQGMVSGQTQEENKLSQPQIALLYYYEGWAITENSGPVIATNYGYKPGRSLYNTFVEKKEQTSRVSGKNAVKDLEAVIPLLSDSARGVAESELTMAKSRRN